MNIAALILAAGSSSRMGEAKQLLPWSKTTLLGNAIQVANNSTVDKVFVVLGAEADRIQKTLGPQSQEVIINKNWREGLGSSLSAGISEIEKSKDVFHAILILLADQPFIDTIYINSLVEHFKAEDGKIIATQYGPNLGVPAIFDKALFSGLQALKGDEGASKLIKSNSEICYGVDPKKKTTDLDTPEDYAIFKAVNSKNKT